MAEIAIRVNDRATRPLSRIRRGFRETDSAVRDSTRSIDRFSGSLKGMVIGLGSAYAGFKAIQGVANLSVSFVQTASTFEQFSVTLQSITGSAQEAKKSMSWIEDFGAKTPFEIDKVTESFVKMKAYGLDPMDGTLKALGNASSAMSKDIVQAVEAMADAVTGENERLKEFGIKASKTGDTIRYAWADSSGKTRDIVIKNNKDMIQSTLNTIFNEKYVGAMDAQSRTFSGMLSNMSDSWTIFKKDVMGAGLYEYLKGILGVLGEVMGETFSSAKGGAAEWSQSIIAGIKGAILSIGGMYDAWNEVKLVFTIVENIGLRVLLALSKAMDWLGDSNKDVVVDMQNAWGNFSVSIQKEWTKAVNAMAKVWNSFYNYFARQFNKASEFFGSKLKIDIKPFAPDVVKDFKEIKKSQDKMSQGTKDINAALKKSTTAMSGLYTATGLEVGLLKAESVIERIDAKVTKMREDALKGNAAEKAAAKDALEALIKKQEHLSSSGSDKAATKASKALAKKVKDEAKAAKKIAKEWEKSLSDRQDDYDDMIKDMADGWKEVGDSIADGLNSAFSAILSGDIQGGFRDLFSDMLSFGVEALTQLGMKAAKVAVITQGQGEQYTAWARMAAMAAQMAALGFAVAFGAGGGSDSAPREIGKDNQSSDTIEGFSDAFKNVINPLLSVTKEMKMHLANIDRAFNGIEKSLSLSAVDFSGRDAAKGDYTEESIWGGSSRTFDSAGLSVGAGSLDDYIKGNVDAWVITQIEHTSSSLFGLIQNSGTDTYTDMLNGADKNFIKYIGDAVNGSIGYMMESALALGLDVDPLKNFDIKAFEIDTTGKTPDEIAEEIEGLISSQLDAVGDGVFSAVGAYAQRGERLTNAAGRIAVENEQIGFALTGMQRVFTDWEDLARFAKESGGAGEGLDNIASYIENFYSESEQFGISVSSLTTQFNALNERLPTTKEAFRGLIESTTDPIKLAQLLSLADAFSTVADAIDSTIAGLREAQSAYITQANVTRSDINSGISGFKYGDSDKISGQIDSWASQQIEAANAAAAAASASASAAVASYNAAAATSNATRSTIISMQEGAYKAFRDLQSFTTEQSFNSLAAAINNKDYAGISSAFNYHASSLANTATSQEDFYLGIAKANALVQGVEAPRFIENMAASTASTAASTATIARINAEAAEMYERLIEQNESLLPEESTYYTDTTLLANLAMDANNTRLDKNNNLLGELKSQNNTMIGLMNKANAAQDTSNALAYEQRLQNGRNYTAKTTTRTQQIGGELG